jgi:hypothetical protein
VRAFTVATYNAFDRGAPPSADFVHVTERPSTFVIRGALPNHRQFYPDRSSDAMAWSARFVEHGHSIHQAWESGRDHGRPGTTPDGYVLSWWGVLDGTDKVAVVGAHLVNNAFGSIKRGERRLRLKLWWQGWRALLAERARLRALGYRTFLLGDFNRRTRDWPGQPPRRIGSGYDAQVYPRGVELLATFSGPANGSDHRPLIARYRIRSRRLSRR